MTRRRSLMLVTGALIMLPTLTSCGHGLTAGDEYVAIGDSYTAAPGTGPNAAEDGCQQSTTNYPHQVAAKLGLELVDVSCSGASTGSVAGAQTTGRIHRPPQDEALSRATDVVTMSLGANDFSTFGALVYGCTARRHTDPNGAPCARADTATGTSTFRKNIDRTQKLLVQAIRRIADRAPHARIVVVGYPQFFPMEGPCAQLPLAAGDYAFAHRVNVWLVRAQEDAAAQAGVEYLDLFGPSKGRDMCARDPWIAGLRPARADGLFLHPYPEEQRLVARLLIELLRESPPAG